MQQKQRLLNQIFTNIICYTLILSFISCGQNRNSGNKSKKSKSSVKEFEQLNKSRENFAKKHLIPMKKEIEDLVNVMEEYQSLSKVLQDSESEEFGDIKALDLDFNSKHGARLQEYQKQSDEISKEHTNKSTIFTEIKKSLIELHPIIERQKTIVKKCSDSITKIKKAATKKLDLYKKRVMEYEKRIKEAASSAKKHKKQAKKDKRKAARAIRLDRKMEIARSATSHAKKSERRAKYAKQKYKSLKRLHKEMRAYSTVQSQSLKGKSKKCRAKITILTGNLKDFSQQNTELKQIHNALNNLAFRNAELFTTYKADLDAYQLYQVKRQKLAGVLQDKVDKLYFSYREKSEQIALKYSENYMAIYEAMANWIKSDEINGDSSLKLMHLLNDNASETPILAKINLEVLAIVNLANKKVGLQTNNPTRSIASFFGIKLPNLNLNLPALPDLNLKLPHINIQLPNLDFQLPKIDLSLPNLPNVSHTFKLPNFDAVQFTEPALKPLGSLAEFKLPEFRIQHIRLAHISVDLKTDVTRFVDHFRGIKIEVPEVKIVHISADIADDIRNPGRVFQNTFRELKAGKDLVDVTLTNARREFEVMLWNLHNETHRFTENISRESNKGLAIVGRTIEAAKEPNNLARMALVYTATIYAGPAGSAIANAMFAKLENPGMSQEDMLKSIAVGMAAGYAVQGVENVSGMQMNAAMSRMTEKVARIAAEVAIEGRSTNSEEILHGIVSGAASIDTQGGFVNKVMADAANPAINYATDRIIKKEQIDQGELGERIAQGIGNGLVRASVEGLVDDYVAPHIPKRVDIVVFKKIMAAISLAGQEEAAEQVQSNVENLPKSEKKILGDWVKGEAMDETVALAEEFFGKPFSELTAQELMNDSFHSQLEIKIAQSVQEDNAISDISLKLSQTDRGVDRRVALAVTATVILGYVGMQLYSLYAESKYRNSVRGTPAEDALGDVYPFMDVAFAAKGVKESFRFFNSVRKSQWGKVFESVKPADLIKNGKPNKLVEKLRTDKGIPKSWNVSQTTRKQKNGISFHKPGTNKADEIRIMPGNPKSPHSVSQNPYVTVKKDGKWLGKNGKVLPDNQREAAHIPVDDFKPSNFNWD